MEKQNVIGNEMDENMTESAMTWEEFINWKSSNKTGDWEIINRTNVGYDKEDVNHTGKYNTDIIFTYDTPSGIIKVIVKQ